MAMFVLLFPSYGCVVAVFLQVREEARAIGERMAAEMAAAGVDVAALQREIAEEIDDKDD